MNKLVGLLIAASILSLLSFTNSSDMMDGKLKDVYKDIPVYKIDKEEQEELAEDNAVDSLVPHHFYDLFGLYKFESLGEPTWMRIEADTDFMIIIISEWEEWGDLLVNLFTVSYNDEIIDLLTIETARDEVINGEHGCRATNYAIDKNLVFTLTETLSGANYDEVTNIRKYQINKSGEIVNLIK